MPKRTRRKETPQTKAKERELTEKRYVTACLEFKKVFNEVYDGSYWLANGFSSTDPDPLVKFAHLYRTTGYTLNQFHLVLGIPLDVLHATLDKLPTDYKVKHLTYTAMRLQRFTYTGRSWFDGRTHGAFN